MGMNQTHIGTDILHITEGGFQKAVVEDPTPILIDFWAPWCGPCRMMNPILEEAAKKLGGKARVAKVNVDEEPRIAEAFGIRGIPTMVLIKDAKVIDVFQGVVPADQLVQRVESALQQSHLDH
jgi:thioredoxin